MLLAPLCGWHKSFSLAAAADRSPDRLSPQEIAGLREIPKTSFSFCSKKMSLEMPWRKKSLQNKRADSETTFALGLIDNQAGAKAVLLKIGLLSGYCGELLA